MTRAQKQLANRRRYQEKLEREAAAIGPGVTPHQARVKLLLEQLYKHPATPVLPPDLGLRWVPEMKTVFVMRG